MSFYEQRKGEEYYTVVKRLIDYEGPLDSIIDIGCWDSPVATWGEFNHRYTVDPRVRPVISGVTPIVAPWPDARSMLPCDKIDVTVCLQTLEHILYATEFADAMLDITRVVAIISVPWKWPKGACEYHVQDPVDEHVMRRITGRQHSELYIVGTKEKRAVFTYRMD